MAIRNTSPSRSNRAVLTVTLTLPRINEDGCVGPADLTEPSELAVHWFKERPGVYEAMTGALSLPERPGEAELVGLEQIARMAVIHYANQIDPTLTVGNGAIVDCGNREMRTYHEPRGTTRGAWPFLLQVTRSLHYATRFYPPAPVERHKYAARDGWPADVTLCNVCHRPGRFCNCHPTAKITAVFEEQD